MQENINREIEAINAFHNDSIATENIVLELPKQEQPEENIATPSKSVPSSTQEDKEIDYDVLLKRLEEHRKNNKSIVWYEDYYKKKLSGFRDCCAHH